MASTQSRTAGPASPDAEPATLEEVWAAPLLAASHARNRARGVFEETIWDASAAGLGPTEIARGIGIRDRRKIYAVISGQRTRQPGPIEKPALQPVIYLRGAQVSQDVWASVQKAMWRRGWHTIMDRTAAFHLSRARVPVIMVDFSVRARDDLKVGLLRAKYGPRPSPDKDQPMEMPMIIGGSRPATYDADGQLDVEAIALAVQEVIGTSLL